MNVKPDGEYELLPSSERHVSITRNGVKFDAHYSGTTSLAIYLIELFVIKC